MRSTYKSNLCTCTRLAKSQSCHQSLQELEKGGFSVLKGLLFTSLLRDFTAQLWDSSLSVTPSCTFCTSLSYLTPRSLHLFRYPRLILRGMVAVHCTLHQKLYCTVRYNSRQTTQSNLGAKAQSWLAALWTWFQNGVTTVQYTYLYGHLPCHFVIRLWHI